MTSPGDSYRGQRWWTANPNIPTLGNLRPSGRSGCQIRTFDTEFHTLTDRTHESFSDQITGRPTVVHDSPPDERLGDAGWTAIYHRHPQTVLQPLSEIINHETE
jgi:hypothetical protein